ncbi:hypothetical protein FKM82_007085 [Ascaphus truei]
MEHKEGPERSVCGSHEDVQDLEIYVGEEISLRASISDQLRVSFYEADHATQTDLSEILDLKDTTSVIQSVVKSVDILKKDVALQKTILQADYEQRIQAQALRLYDRINDAVRDLEAVHKKKVAMLRRSFQIELIDALAVIRAYYKNYYIGSTGIDFDTTRDAKEAFSDRSQAPMCKLDDKDILIQSLEAQIIALKENEPPKQIIFQSEDDPEKEKLQEENKELIEKMDTLQDKIQQLKDALKQKEKHIHSLDRDVGAMKQKMEMDQKTIEKMSSVQETLKIELEKEKSIATTLLEKQKAKLGKVMETKLKENVKEQAEMHKEHGDNQLEEAKRQRQMMILETEELKLKQQIIISSVETVSTEKENLSAQSKKLLPIKEEQDKTIERYNYHAILSICPSMCLQFLMLFILNFRLKRELERTNKTWEKKFDILKQSFHAIKDEMFLRQSLHRQAMNIPRVSVNYKIDGAVGAVGVVPTGEAGKSSFYLPALPLPKIGVKTSPKQRINVAASYTSGQDHDIFTEDELQVVSDGEEDLEGVPPLPSPPSSRHEDLQFINV